MAYFIKFMVSGLCKYTDGGNRVKKSRWIWNLFVVWLFTGIWHGANWTFWVWGLFYFVLLLLEKTTKFPEKLRGFSHVYTLAAVIIAWVVFRSADLSEALKYLRSMFGIGAGGIVDDQFWHYLKSGNVVLLPAIIFTMPLYPWLKNKLRTRKMVLETVESVFIMGVFILSLIMTMSATYNPFIYFNF